MPNKLLIYGDEFDIPDANEFDKINIETIESFIEIEIEYLKKRNNFPFNLSFLIEKEENYKKNINEKDININWEIISKYLRTSDNFLSFKEKSEEIINLYIELINNWISYLTLEEIDNYLIFINKKNPEISKKFYDFLIEMDSKIISSFWWLHSDKEEYLKFQTLYNFHIKPNENKENLMKELNKKRNNHSKLKISSFKTEGIFWLFLTMPFFYSEENTIKISSLYSLGGWLMNFLEHKKKTKFKNKWRKSRKKIY